MSDYVLNGLLALMALAIAISFIRYNADPKYDKFNLIDLITTKDGKLHRPAVMEFGAFVLMTWGFIVLINRNRLAEWYAAIYVGAFVVRSAYSAWLRQKGEREERDQDYRSSNRRRSRIDESET